MHECRIICFGEWGVGCGEWELRRANHFVLYSHAPLPTPHTHGRGTILLVLDRLRELISHHWGYDSFRPLQQEAMMAAIEGRDSLVVMPTGGGKSLCYQAPALLSEHVTVVVSPLISLMKDQVDGLRECGVAAAPQVGRDIAEQLFLRDPLMLVGDFDRPNLTYRVLPRHDE